MSLESPAIFNKNAPFSLADFGGFVAMDAQISHIPSLYEGVALYHRAKDMVCIF